MDVPGTRAAARGAAPGPGTGMVRRPRGGVRVRGGGGLHGRVLVRPLRASEWRRRASAQEKSCSCAHWTLRIRHRSPCSDVRLTSHVSHKVTIAPNVPP